MYLKCGAKGMRREFVHEPPDHVPLDFEKFTVVRFYISGDLLDPDSSCRRCKLEGFRKSLNCLIAILATSSGVFLFANSLFT